MSLALGYPKLVVAKILETNYTRSARSDALLAKNYFLIYCASTIKRQTMKRNSEYN